MTYRIGPLHMNKQNKKTFVQDHKIKTRSVFHVMSIFPAENIGIFYIFLFIYNTFFLEMIFYEHKIQQPH